MSEQPRPFTGTFRSAEGNTPRGVTPAPEPVAPPAPPPPPAPAPVAETTTEAEEERVLTPAEVYRNRLKDADVPLSKASSIFDAVMSKGFYEEYVRLPGNRRACFRTRLYEDHLRLATALETERPSLALTQDELVRRYNLAASLYEWDGKALEHETEEDFDAAMRVVRRLPAPIYSMLANELARFDAKITVIFSDGAADSF